MAKRIARLGLFLAAAMVAGYVEHLIPFDFGVPGIKLGLANSMVLYLMYRDGVKEAAAVNLLRILLVGILFGNLFGILYSLAGGALSVAAMALSKRIKALGPVGVSVIGAVCHNIGQIAVAAAVLSTAAVIYYLPFLMISGVVTGCLMGVLTWLLIQRTDI